MTKKQSNNPWAHRDLEREQEPMAQPDEKLHSGDELVDEELDEEIEDLEETEETTAADSEVHKKLAEARDQLIRAHAEIDNVRRRAEQDIAKAHKFGNEKFIKDLLPVIDSLEQAIQNKTDDNPVVEGVELTLKMFSDVLARFNVKQLDPVNEKFDPQLHEAISMQENKEVPTNTVLAVVQKGYTLNDRLIRPARVVVSR